MERFFDRPGAEKERAIMLTVIRGAGDIATGVALRLWRSGVQVVMTDLPSPTAIRRTVCFSQAIVLGRAAVEDVTAVRAETGAEALALLKERDIPVLPDPAGTCISRLRPDAVVDAILAKKNLGTKMTDAPASRWGWTVTRWWRRCAATRWAGRTMKVPRFPTRAFPDSSAVFPASGSSALRRTGGFVRSWTSARR